MSKMSLQELIVRARFLFNGAPSRRRVFELVNGRRSSKEIARIVGRGHRSVLNDLKKMVDLELIRPKRDSKGNIIKKDGCIVYEKNPLLAHVPKSYFEPVVKRPLVKPRHRKRTIKERIPSLSIPSEKEMLEIFKEGESQIYEFKAPGIEIRKITREIAAFANTKSGGIIFYGVDDDGTIIGSDKKRQDFDQQIQNSVRNLIRPSLNVRIVERKVLGTSVLLIIVPPWDRKHIYQFEGSKYLIRKGTNVFAISPEELKKLAKGETVI